MAALKTVVAFGTAVAASGNAVAVAARSALDGRDQWKALVSAFDLLSLPVQKTVRDRHGNPAMGVRLQDVVYEAGDRCILDGVSLELPAGSSLAVVGGSGTGKTTVAMLLLGKLTANGQDRSAELKRKLSWASA